MKILAKNKKKLEKKLQILISLKAAGSGSRSVYIGERIIYGSNWIWIRIQIRNTAYTNFTWFKAFLKNLSIYSKILVLTHGNLILIQKNNVFPIVLNPDPF